MTAKKTKKPVKKQQRSAACTQADKNRDSKGRFVKGNTPKTSFRDRPQDIYNIADDETKLRKEFKTPRRIRKHLTANI